MSPVRPDEPPDPIVGFDARGAIVVRYDGKDYAMCPEPLSDARDEHDRREENLHFGANPTLERIRIHYGVAMMMTAAIYVARYYGVAKDELLALWVKHYGPGFLAEKRPASAPELQADELKLCSRCHRKTGFDLDADGDLVSECCGWPGVAADRDPT